MPRFKYVGRNKDARQVEGSVETESQAAAVGLVERLGVVPSRVEPEIAPRQRSGDRQADGDQKPREVPPARDRIANYFKPFPKWTVWAIVVGVFLLGVKFLGAIPILFAAYALYRHFTGRPTDQEMDEFFRQDIEDAKNEAVERCQFDTATAIAEPVVVWGPNTEGSPWKTRVGKDGILRYNLVDLFVVFFGPQQLSCYYCSYDRCTGMFTRKDADEYFYKGIVSVGTRTENQSEEFVLTTSGGTTYQITVNAPSLSGGKLHTPPAAKVVNDIRRVLREKAG